MASLAARSLTFQRLAAAASRSARQGPAVLLPAASRCWFSSYPPHEVVGLPSLSPTMETGSIAAWSLKEGDSFGAGDVFCSVETDKATVDFEAQDDGVLAKILVPGGDGTELKVGDPIMVTTESEDDVAAFSDFEAPTSSSSSDSSSSASSEATPPPPPPAAASPPPAAAAPTPPPAVAAASSSGDRVVASPLARALAKELGHDVASIAGTGPAGRILAADVKEYVPTAASDGAAAPTAAAGTQPLLSSPIAGDGYTDYPLTATAQQVAARLQQAKRNVPHYYLTVDVGVDGLLKLRETLNQGLKDDDDKIGVYELLLKAAACSMKAVPSANAAWMDSHVRVFEHVDMNVVLGEGDNLYTPVLTNVGAKGLKAISSELKTLADALPSSEPEGGEDEAPPPPPPVSGLGTFTVMNLGMYGIKSCAPIIREPQSCALAIGALENRIVPNDDEDDDEIYKEAIMMTATLSCDHRVVDGAVGAQWLAAFKSHVENPSTLLL